MSGTATVKPTRRTRRTTTTATADAVAIDAGLGVGTATAEADAVPADVTFTLEGEAVAEVKALMGEPTAENMAKAISLIGAADDRLALLTFHGRVAVSAMVGYALKGQATLNEGTTPDGFTAAADSVKVYAKGGAEWLGRRYSTLEQCWRIATHHSAERLERFVESWHAVHGKNPEAVAAYAAWCNADAKTGKNAAKASLETLATRKASADKAKAKAEATAIERRSQRSKLHNIVKGAATPEIVPVAGCPLTVAQWKAMSAETLLAVALLADAMRVALNKATDTADEAETVNAVAAETGPVPATPKRGAKVTK